jgi:glutamyl-Q tRNA(Asp) synthetase
MPGIGRFAPTPSGPLHFGSLVAALASYCQARSRQGSWLLRIEDVDTPRVIKGAGDSILRDLEDLGFEWDGNVSYQSDRFELYREYLLQLMHQGDCFACECSRRSLRDQNVQSGVLGQIYPGNCRQKNLPDTAHSIRLNTNNAGTIAFQDQVYGHFEMNLAVEVGDFVLRRADQVYAYHLAVVVDDEIEEIDEVVRGADLLENSCLHIWLQNCLGFRRPEYMHLPLVNNIDGTKLSKQTGADPIRISKAGDLLYDALIHLGQSPPPDLALVGSREILSWAIEHWDASRIPAPRTRDSEVL